MSSNPLLIIGLVVLVGVALNFARFWMFVSTVGGTARTKVSRISELDAHLPFDERIAERMRELEQEGASKSVSPANNSAAPGGAHFTPPAPAPAPQGFGRRGL